MKKTVIVYGKYSGITGSAIKRLSEIIFEYTMKFPVCVECSHFLEEENTRYIFIGTKQDNEYIKKYSDKELKHPEEYYIKVLNDNVLIEGSDDGGVLYGCMDFYNKYIVNVQNTHDHATYFKNIFEEGLPEFQYSSYPKIKDRGLWTWGHVIYDYKGYIDNMAKLKMNTVIIWNDFVPVNAREMIEYAHDLNIKVIWGFPWGWDTAEVDVDVKNIDSRIDSIISHYEENYANLGGDGIYFQSFTEKDTETIDGVLIAEAVTEFVNKTSKKLLDKYPDLELQFGLHATSVNEKLQYISKVNEKITIVWEDCGAFPFAYIPQKIDDFEKTCDFTKEILSLRGESEKAGVVLKGFTCLDWLKFEHQEGSYYLGSVSGNMCKNRMNRKESIWRYVQAYWLKNADKAYEMIRLMQKETDGNVLITALVEDSMFEQKLYYPVALFGEMLWAPERDLSDIICEVALNSCVEFI